MSKILWISACVPYDTVPHAGGKIHNYYLKYLKLNSSHEIKLISFYWKREKNEIDLQKYGIDNMLLERTIMSFPGTLYNVESFFNPFNRYAGVDQNYTVHQLKSTLRKVKINNYVPDIIILQWTEMLILLPIVKRYFPNSQIIGIEEDVKFLSFQRIYESETNPVLKIIKKIKYKRLLKVELDACRKADRIILNNDKDRRLLEDKGINCRKLSVWQPYFESRLDNKYYGTEKNIIFYGAMSRDENWKSAIWFIENVFYKLADNETKFLVIGANPNPELKKYENDRVKIVGFVDDVAPYFQKSACLVAPLLLGAGIKVKIIEAMSAGIPVVTNNIGIEGIPVVNGKEYIHCEKPPEYVSAVDKLIESSELRDRLSRNEKRFIDDRFNLEKSAENFLKMLI